MVHRHIRHEPTHCTGLFDKYTDQTSRCSPKSGCQELGIESLATSLGSRWATWCQCRRLLQQALHQRHNVSSRAPNAAASHALSCTPPPISESNIVMTCHDLFDYPAPAGCREGAGGEAPQGALNGEVVKWSLRCNTRRCRGRPKHVLDSRGPAAEVRQSSLRSERHARQVPLHFVIQVANTLSDWCSVQVLDVSDGAVL